MIFACVPGNGKVVLAAFSSEKLLFPTQVQHVSRSHLDGLVGGSAHIPYIHPLQTMFLCVEIKMKPLSPQILQRESCVEPATRLCNWV